MRKYTVKYAEKPNWSEIPVVPIDNLCWTDSIDITAYGQACYDGEGIFVHLHADEKNISCEEKPPLGAPCEDSCLEFFFCPDKNSTKYFNFEFNPIKTMHLGIGKSDPESVRLIVDNYVEFFKVETVVTDSGWDLYYKVPFEFIRRFFDNFEPKGEMRANMYKCGDLTVKEHYLSWNPMTNPTPAFHKPNDFGVFCFEER